MDHLDAENSTDNATSASPGPRGAPGASSGPSEATSAAAERPSDSESEGPSSAAKRRRGSRGGQRRRGSGEGGGPSSEPAVNDDRNDVELPKPIREGRPSVEAAEKALVRKPRIGDTMPMPTAPASSSAAGSSSSAADSTSRVSTGDRVGSDKRRRRRGGGGADGGAGELSVTTDRDAVDGDATVSGRGKKSRRGRGRGRTKGEGAELDDATLAQRKGRERNGKPIGRYFMAVQVRAGMTQVAVLEGRNLIEHYVSRPADDVSQIHGNIYVGRIQNVLPGMEAAFVDIATPKNAVLYRGDVQYDPEDIEEGGKDPRIEDILKNKQLIICQVTKNPIAHKGARLTQEVSLPGRFVVLIPNSKTYGISKRLPDDVRKRLRGILDRVKPAEHGLIVRTAAETATEDELIADMKLLLRQWEEVAAKAATTQRPALLYREPEMAVRVIREEFNANYRGVVIDDERLYRDVRDYVAAFNPELADRIEFYDGGDDGSLSLFEKFHIHEQVHKALDRKVWLPSGGSLIIEHTEALTVIDVNTGKNVGKSSLEETVFHNNMEAAEEIAKQLRLRDIGGIIVIDFIDMEVKGNRAKVVERFRDALARDKTRSQVFDITELGLVEMTRKRIGEGLLTEYSEICPDCDGRGVVVDYGLLE
jgi:ribonuclease E